MLKRGWQKVPTAQDDARALLDSLMGPSRDKRAASSGHAREGFLDRSVCKRYLLGLCPNDWFKSTKREMAQCGGIHSDILREELEAHPERERYVAEFESQLLEYLEDICMDADRWVARERGNLKPPGKELQLSLGWQKSIAEKQETYKEMIERSQTLAEDEDLKQSHQVMERAQALQDEIDSIEAKFTVDTGGEGVCELCGVRFPLGNTPNEIGNRQSHFSGKMHEAYTTIREKVEELRRKKKSGVWDEFTKDSKFGKEGERRREDSRIGHRSRSRSRAKRSRSSKRKKRKDKRKTKEELQPKPVCSTQKMRSRSPSLSGLRGCTGKRGSSKTSS